VLGINKSATDYSVALGYGLIPLVFRHLNTNDPMAFDKASLDKLGTNGIEFD
jgi:hypothetical protein